MGLFGRKTIFKSEEQKKADSLPRTKKVQFEPQKLSEAETALDNDINKVISYNPVNYYATKNQFLQCTFFYNENYSEIYMRLDSYLNDHCTGEGKTRLVDFQLFKAVLRKFGVNI